MQKYCLLPESCQKVTINNDTPNPTACWNRKCLKKRKISVQEWRWCQWTGFRCVTNLWTDPHRTVNWKSSCNLNFSARKRKSRCAMLTESNINRITDIIKAKGATTKYYIKWVHSYANNVLTVFNCFPPRIIHLFFSLMSYTARSY